MAMQQITPPNPKEKKSQLESAAQAMGILNSIASLGTGAYGAFTSGAPTADVDLTGSGEIVPTTVTPVPPGIQAPVDPLKNVAKYKNAQIIS